MVPYIKIIVKQKNTHKECSWCRWLDSGPGTEVSLRGDDALRKQLIIVFSQSRGATCCGLAPTGVKSRRELKSQQKNTHKECSWCRWPDSNRHGSFPPRDFKSLASAISPHRHIKFVQNINIIKEGIHPSMKLKLEAPIRLELMIKVLQTLALPLGDGATSTYLL